MDIEQYLNQALSQQDSDEDYNRRVRIGGDLMSLFNVPSGAEIYAKADIAKPNYQAQAQRVIESEPNKLDQAGKIASVLSAYRAQKNDSPEAKAKALELQEKIKLANDLELQKTKHKNDLELLKAKQGLGIKEVVDPETGEVKQISTKEPVASQFTVGGYARRVEQAEDVFNKLNDSGFDRGGLGQRILDLPFVPSEAGQAFSPERGEQDQAERNFLTAVLRKESGASISPTERSEGAKQYFDRPGDTDEVKAQKRANRAQSLAALKAEAGPALARIPKVAGVPREPGAAAGASKSEINKILRDSDRKMSEEALSIGNPKNKPQGVPAYTAPPPTGLTPKEQIDFERLDKKYGNKK